MSLQYVFNNYEVIANRDIKKGDEIEIPLVYGMKKKGDTIETDTIKLVKD